MNSPADTRLIGGSFEFGRSEEAGASLGITLASVDVAPGAGVSFDENVGNVEVVLLAGGGVEF